MSKVFCLNKDREGKCQAFTKAQCSESCGARIVTNADLQKQLRDIIKYCNEEEGKRELQERLREIQKHKYGDWYGAYLADRARGNGGGSSEHDANRSTSLKQRMKDNRPLDQKMNSEEKREYEEAVNTWEWDNGKLPRLSRSSLGRSKGDSYIDKEPGET